MRIDQLLGEIDDSLVTALQEVVQGEHELSPLFEACAREWGLFTLPRIRTL